MKKIISIICAVAILFSVFSIRSLAVNSTEFVNYEDIEGLVYVQFEGYIDESGEYIALDVPVVLFQSDYRVSIVYRGNLVRIFIEIVVGSLVYGFLVGLTGVDIGVAVGEFVKNKVIELYGYLAPYTYNYTADNGCYSAAFPANPFCRIAY